MVGFDPGLSIEVNYSWVCVDVPDDVVATSEKDISRINLSNNHKNPKTIATTQKC